MSYYRYVRTDRLSSVCQGGQLQRGSVSAPGWLLADPLPAAPQQEPAPKPTLHPLSDHWFVSGPETTPPLSLHPSQGNTTNDASLHTHYVHSTLAKVTLQMTVHTHSSILDRPAFLKKGVHVFALALHA